MGDLNNNGLKMCIYIQASYVRNKKKLFFRWRRRSSLGSRYTELYRMKLCYIKWINLLFSLLYTRACLLTPLHHSRNKKEAFVVIFFSEQWKNSHKKRIAVFYLCRQCKSTYMVVTPAIFYFVATKRGSSLS